MNSDKTPAHKKARVKPDEGKAHPGDTAWKKMHGKIKRAGDRLYGNETAQTTPGLKPAKPVQTTSKEGSAAAAERLYGNVIKPNSVMGRR